MADFAMDPILFEAIHKHWREFEDVVENNDVRIKVTNGGAAVGRNRIVGKLYAGITTGEAGAICFCTRSGGLTDDQRLNLMNFMNLVKRDGALRRIEAETIE